MVFVTWWRTSFLYRKKAGLLVGSWRRWDHEAPGTCVTGGDGGLLGLYMMERPIVAHLARGRALYLLTNCNTHISSNITGEKTSHSSRWGPNIVGDIFWRRESLAAISADGFTNNRINCNQKIKCRLRQGIMQEIWAGFVKNVVIYWWTWTRVKWHTLQNSTLYEVSDKSFSKC